jgi:hypothetical protein
MKGRGRTRWRRQGGADRIEWLTGDWKDVCEGDEGARFCARGASDVPDGELSRRER